MNYYEGLVGK